MKSVKVIVKKDMSACADIRFRYEGEEFSDFITGLDLVGNIWVASHPKIWSYTLKDLIMNLMHYMDLENMLYKMPSEIVLSDDTIEYSDEEIDTYYGRVQENLNKYYEKEEMALKGFTLQENGDYVGNVEF